MWTAITSFVTTVLIYGLVLLVGLWCAFQWTHWGLLQVARKLPCPYYPIPVLGHFFYSIRGLEWATQWALRTVEEYTLNGVHTIVVWVGPLPILLFQGPDDIQKILNSSSTAEKSHEYDCAKFAFGNGLLTAPNAVWKITRRHINPMFQNSNLEQLMPVFNRNSRELMGNLSQHADQGPFNVFQYTMDMSLKNVCQLIFGSDFEFDTKSEGFQSLKKVMEKILEVWVRRLILIWFRVDVIFNWFYKKEKEEQKILWDNFTETCLQKGRLNDDNQKSSGSSQQEGPITLLQAFRSLQKDFPNFTDEDLKFEMVTFYITGTDTVSLLTASCLLILGEYQDVQEKLYQEIRSVMEPDDDVTTQDLNRMSYLDQVYKETLRWATIVPFIGRRVTEDITLSSCKVPAGSMVAVSLFGLNMNPKTFPNPKVFDPERFASNSSEEHEKNDFLPFSGGPRNCIGKRYAEMFMKTMTVHVLRKYKVTTKMDVHNMKRKVTITLVSTEGYNISLQKRR